MFRSQALRGPAADQRSAERSRVQVDVQSAQRDTFEPVVVHNVSGGGLLFESEATHERGDELALVLPCSEWTPAKIVWRSGRFHGAEFQSPISPALVARLRLASVVIRPAFEAAATQCGGQSVPDARCDVATGVGTMCSAPLLPVALRVQLILALSAALWASVLASVALGV